MKFKNAKKTKKIYKKAKSQKKKKFPSISRIIPESIKGEMVLFSIGIFVIFAAILIISTDLYINITKQKNMTNEKIRILNEISFWENELGDYPNYRDAYFNLALLNYELRDFDKAFWYLNKTLSLDPNFEKAKELEKLIGG